MSILLQRSGGLHITSAASLFPRQLLHLIAALASTKFMQRTQMCVHYRCDVQKSITSASLQCIFHEYHNNALQIELYQYEYDWTWLKCIEIFIHIFCTWDAFAFDHNFKSIYFPFSLHYIVVTHCAHTHTKYSIFVCCA